MSFHFHVTLQDQVISLRARGAAVNPFSGRVVSDMPMKNEAGRRDTTESVVSRSFVGCRQKRKMIPKEEGHESSWPPLFHGAGDGTRTPRIRSEGSSLLVYSINLFAFPPFG